MAKAGAEQAASSSTPVLSKHERKKAKAKAKKLLRKQASSGTPAAAVAAAAPAVVPQKKADKTTKSLATAKPLTSVSKPLLAKPTAHSAAAVASANAPIKKSKHDDAGAKPPKATSKVTEHPTPAEHSIPAKASPKAFSVPVLSKYERKKAKAKAKKQLRKQASSAAPEPAAAAAAPPAAVPQKKLLNAADSSAVPSSKKRRRDDAGTKPPKLVSKVTEHPFLADYCDHFETPLRAYEDVAEVLTLLAKRLGKTPATLRLWDPYFCEGRTVRHLAALGFTSVHHENKGYHNVVTPAGWHYYKATPVSVHYWHAAHVPCCAAVLVVQAVATVDTKLHSKQGEGVCSICTHELTADSAVLLYSYIKLHITYEHRWQQQHDFLLCDYYRKRALSSGVQPFYILPHVRYEFDHPDGTGHETSPFIGMWFIYLGKHTEPVYAA
eukprot:20758-Heterococcus_DN1.PRE.2